jgi:hypothetical protein
MMNWFPKTSVDWLVVLVGIAMVSILILPPLHQISQIKAQSVEPRPYLFSYGEIVTLKITGQKVSVVRDLGNHRCRILYADDNGHLDEIDVWDKDLTRPGIDD